MNTTLMWILTRTPLHVGSGSSVGAIDMPVARERHTQIPIIPGTSLKGVLRSLWTEPEAEKIFGKQDEAGKLIIGEARVLLFPVRSARGAFAWVTCPLTLARYARDAGLDLQIPGEPGEKKALASGETVIFKNERKITLEEYAFGVEVNFPPDWAQHLTDLFGDADPVWSLAKERLVLLNTEDFSYFVEYACEVQTRIRIDPTTGTVSGHMLFNQENVPSETLFYAALAERKGRNGVMKQITDKLDDYPMLQFGGDETTGHGFCSVKLL